MCSKQYRDTTESKQLLIQVYDLYQSTYTERKLLNLLNIKSLIYYVAKQETNCLSIVLYKLSIQFCHFSGFKPPANNTEGRDVYGPLPRNRNNYLVR